MNLRRRHLLAAAGSSLAFTAFGQESYPSRPIKLIIPYGAGGSGDAAARSIGDALAKTWGQSFVVDNRPGANEIIATTAVVQSPADGYTFLIASEAAVSTNPFLYKKLPYDPTRDLIPVTQLLSSPYVLVVRPDLPVKTLREYVDYVRRNAGKLNFGSQGVGGPNHLSMAWFNRINDLQMEHVPYRTLPQGIQEVMAGRVDAMFAPVGSTSPFIRSGKLTALSIGGKDRQKEIPDVPTFGESGYPQFETSFYLGVFAPRGTPSFVVSRLAADIAKVVKDPIFVTRFFDPQAYSPVGSTPSEFMEFLRRDREEAGLKVRIAGVTLD